MKKKTMSIGGATYDLFVRIPHEVIDTCKNTEAFALPLGEKIRVQEVIETCGGGASNTSVGLARLGCDAHFEGVIGSDQWGDKLHENFQKEGVNTDCVTFIEGEVSSFSIILSASSGERVILYESGANEHLHDSNFDRDHAQKMDWVYLNHIQAQSCVIQDNLVEILANEGCPSLTWNPGGCQIDMGLEPSNNKTLLEHTSLLLLNKEEAERFTKSDSLETAMEALIDVCPGIICITNGKQGTTATDGKNIFSCPIIGDNKASDTTGAGDAFGTGMTWALIEGFSLPEALKAGNINAASVVAHFGAQAGLLTDTEIRKRLQESDLSVDSHPLD